DTNACAESRIDQAMNHDEIRLEGGRAAGRVREIKWTAIVVLWQPIRRVPISNSSRSAAGIES
ncbi:MAG: hypothetical protein AAGJ83_08555, partial [Planctomycetota bacterium]